MPEKMPRSYFKTQSQPCSPTIPLTMRSAAADSWSTLVWTVQTYFPACFSWMFRIIKSPAESC